MKTFKHSGDLGDIIFSLPAIRALGGGALYLDPEGGESSKYVAWSDKTRTKLNAASIDGIKDILILQPYISSVDYWTGQEVDYDLDQFREHISFNNLSDSHLNCFQLDHSERDKVWLTNIQPKKLHKPVVITRSPRVHGNHSFWENNLPSLKDRCVFVGFEKEYEIFEYTFNYGVEYYKTETMLELAEVIQGCELFVGNQGFAHALAEGMKKPLINEVYRIYPAAFFKRPDAQYV